ncbi:YeeE/YedE family protein [Silvimonas iriomotensis]|uniref:YeeE/YedE family protein n=1 Tax=Silvimonas iriomotensis TaxID=449662 RepID=A0ABQ2P575_9NEIS|nr:YeeE/YedE family protein [Silvimonas iriomotensis]GGP18515.1 hypothetical protein GCM10010970_05370 [Silvimonas iriomotensis]
MGIVFAAIGGLVFGLGLIVSGMANPAKVTGFLDLAGQWDPSLAFVMGGAIAVALPLFWLARKRTQAVTAETLQWPQNKQIDKPLLLGALIFGAGWGLAGICPGPALVLVGAGVPQGIAFTVAMLAGMSLYELLGHRINRS